VSLDHDLKRNSYIPEYRLESLIDYSYYSSYIPEYRSESLIDYSYSILTK
jgi:hypothetical protein